MHVLCICDILDIYKTHAMQCSDNRGSSRYCYGSGVQEYIILYIYMYVYIYMYETRGVWGHAPPPPPGKIKFLGEIMLHLRPF